MFAEVPFIQESDSLVLDIDYTDLIEGRVTQEGRAIVILRDGAQKRETWRVLSVIEYLAYYKAGKLAANKTLIKADGLDTATITAEVHPDLTELTFYHADTNEVITAVPVDPATHTATLEVTATTPGIINIRAGESTMTRLNEVVINAN